MSRLYARIQALEVIGAGLAYVKCLLGEWTCDSMGGTKPSKREARMITASLIGGSKT